ncbi:MAG TPA: aldehyde dehydrogenase family protein [Terriglobales bacterium]|nr:aldehyde dehydrogenase family protein [Terriglobales bacterium]
MSAPLDTLTEKLETIAKKLVRYSGFDGQFIDGHWRPGHRGRTSKDTDPYTGETVAEIAMADLSDVEEAYQSAAKAQPAWASVLPAERGEVLHRCADLMERRRDEILDWLIHESGSTRIKAGVEWQMLHAITTEAASFPHRVAGRVLPIDEPGKESRVYRQPLGVIGVISPWNFPIYLAQRSVGPAIALGNTVVLKPSQDTPVTGGLLLAKIFEEAGVPSGVLNVVIGASGEIGDAFLKHPIPRLISFTGSTAVGRHIADLAVTSPMIKRLALELGGNTPFVVLDDADLDKAVPAAIFSRFLHQGQICMSTNRIVVDSTVYDEFVDRFTAHVKTLQVGNPQNPETVIGPIINSNQLANMLKHVKDTRNAGARQLLGGDPNGLVLPPHVFADVTNAMPVAKNETFGPIAPIIRVRGEREALQLANDTEYGLSSAVFTRDERRGLRFALGLQAGMTHINDTSVDDTPTGPFGGEKNSGIGRFGGDFIIDEFTTPHWITVQHSPRQYPF